MTERKASTINLSGSDYAKVAERLRLFRTDWPNSKIETHYEYEVDKSVIFTVWIWKDKTDYIDVLKEVKNAEIARGSSDANGTARGEVGVKQKDFEKLESIALGRALAMLGYLASGEIASFEEMEEFNKFRDQQQAEAVAEVVQTFKDAKTLDELKKAFVASKMMNVKEVVAAKDERKAELSKTKEEPEIKPVGKTGHAKVTDDPNTVNEVKEVKNATDRS